MRNPFPGDFHLEGARLYEQTVRSVTKLIQTSLARCGAGRIAVLTCTRNLSEPTVGYRIHTPIPHIISHCDLDHDHCLIRTMLEDNTSCPLLLCLV